MSGSGAGRAEKDQFRLAPRRSAEPTRTVRDQFLVEVDTTGAGGGSACGSLAELNCLFTAWLHQRYHRGVHSETGAAPAQRYHAEGRDRPPTPDPAQLRRAFLWREQRKVTAFATVWGPRGGPPGYGRNLPSGWIVPVEGDRDR